MFFLLQRNKHQDNMLLRSNQVKNPSTEPQGATQQVSPAEESTAAASKPSQAKNKKYCLCKKSAQGLVVIQCVACRDWFHGWCVQIDGPVANR